MCVALSSRQAHSNLWILLRTSGVVISPWVSQFRLNQVGNPMSDNIKIYRRGPYVLIAAFNKSGAIEAVRLITDPAIVAVMQPDALERLAWAWN